VIINRLPRSWQPSIELFQFQVTTTGEPEDFILQTDDAAVLIIRWGDESSNVYSGSGLRTHSYASPGVYTVTVIGGTASRIAFGAASCTPTLVTAILLPVSVSLGLTSAAYMFAGCANITSWAEAFIDAASANITDMNHMFHNCSAFNQSVAGFDTSNVTDMNYMFFGCTIFNQPVATFDTTLVTNVNSMFYQAPAFDQSLAAWVVTALTGAWSMLEQSGFTQTNYDLLLVAWEGQLVLDNVHFHAGTAKYGAGAPATAHADLIADHSWTIDDGGPA